MDFNFKIYTQLLQSLQNAGFFFQTFAEYITQETNSLPESQPRYHDPTPPHAPTHPRKIILRHDVEARYENALQMARIQYKMGIRGSYYFRFLPKSYSTEIIKEIADLGHEIGYHYDDLSACKGNREEALKRFQHHLEELRKIAPVQTMTMEGAPLSPYDNRDLWKPEHRTPNNRKFPSRPYHAYGILAEPYFDIDFNKLYYITDTGRRWDGHLYNVRDKATKENPITNPDFLKLRFHSTQDLIMAINQRGIIDQHRSPCTDHSSQITDHSSQITDHSSRITDHSSRITDHSSRITDHSSRITDHSSRITDHSSPNPQQIFPQQAMLNFHPQRWNDAFLPWMKELLWQNVKNQGKRVLVLLRK